MHGRSRRARSPHFHNRFDDAPTSPNQLRWDPLPLPTAPTDFVDGLFTMAGNGSAGVAAGCGIHVYAANRSMQGRFFYDADGELLIVPQQGRAAHRHRAGRARSRAAGDRRDSARHPLPRRTAGRRSARLRLRELRRRAAPARPRPDRLERPGQRARFPHAGRGVRGRRWRLRADREIPGPPVARADRSFAARRRRLARQLRAVQVRPAPLQRDRLDQLRPSRSVDLHRADLALRHARRRRTSTS